MPSPSPLDAVRGLPAPRFILPPPSAADRQRWRRSWSGSLVGQALGWLLLLWLASRPSLSHTPRYPIATLHWELTELAPPPHRPARLRPYRQPRRGAPPRPAVLPPPPAAPPPTVARATRAARPRAAPPAPRPRAETVAERAPAVSRAAVGQAAVGQAAVAHAVRQVALGSFWGGTLRGLVPTTARGNVHPAGFGAAAGRAGPASASAGGNGTGTAAVQVAGFGGAPVRAGGAGVPGGRTVLGVFEPPPPPPPAASAVARHQEFRPAEILAKPRPLYTAAARARRLEGEVVLRARLTAARQVEVLDVVAGLGAGLDEAAERAAHAIRFRPAERNGQPVDSIVLLHISFHLAS